MLVGRATWFDESRDTVDQLELETGCWRLCSMLLSDYFFRRTDRGNHSSWLRRLVKLRWCGGSRCLRLRRASIDIASNKIKDPWCFCRNMEVWFCQRKSEDIVTPRYVCESTNDKDWPTTTTTTTSKRLFGHQENNLLLASLWICSYIKCNIYWNWSA